MNRIVSIIVSTVFMSILFVPCATAIEIPREPGQEKVLYRYIQPQNRAFVIVYDLDGDAKGDYMTQRDIGPNYSLIMEHPSFYAYDENGDGKVNPETEVLADPQRDGLNGNEMPLREWEEQQKRVEG